MKKICFIGAGNISEALINGLLDSGLVNKKNIIATDIKPERLRYIANKYNIITLFDNKKAICIADIIIIAVKPKDIENVLNEISDSVNIKQLVISVCAGITIKFIHRYLSKYNNLHMHMSTPCSSLRPKRISSVTRVKCISTYNNSNSVQNSMVSHKLKKIHIIRVMPNICVSVKEGMTAISKGEYATQKDVKIAEEIFSVVGKTIRVEEKLMNIITACSGSGPAYLFYFAEKFIEGVKKLGLTHNQADILVKQTISGASRMLLTENPQILRKKVTSPGGTTEKAIKYFEDNNFNKIIESGIKQAFLRAQDLTK